MDTSVSITTDSTPDDLRSLRSWLLESSELRGRVSLAQRPPGVDQLGPTVEAILVAMGPGGAAAALATGLLSWIRHRTGDINLKLTLQDGRSLEVEARRVRALDADGLRTHIDQLGHALTVLSPPPFGPEDHGASPRIPKSRTPRYPLTDTHGGSEDLCREDSHNWRSLPAEPGVTTA